MSLPSIAVPTYEMIVPSSGKKIKFRPFLVKEEKLLLMALESHTEEEMYSTIKQVISGCIQGGLDVDSLPIFDVEFIYLKLRSKSIGEKAKVNFHCTECKEQNAHMIDFEQAKVDKSKSLPPKVAITSTMGIVMKYPTLDVSLKMATEKHTTQQMFDFVLDCMESVYDGENVMKVSDYSREELATFVEGLGNDTFERMVEFLDKMPTLRYSSSFKCKKCSHENKVEVTESSDFF